MGEWVRNHANSQRVVEYLQAVVRVATYAADQEHLSAAQALEQIRSAFTQGVLYMDGGWQTLVDGLAARLAACADPFRPRNHQRIADAAAVGVLLIPAQRRVRGHGPAVREIAMAVRPADIFQPGDLFGQGFGLEIVGTHGVDEAIGAAFLTGAIV